MLLLPEVLFTLIPLPVIQPPCFGIPNAILSLVGQTILLKKYPDPLGITKVGTRPVPVLPTVLVILG